VGEGWQLLTIRGIPLRIHPSWFVILLLATLGFQQQYALSLRGQLTPAALAKLIGLVEGGRVTAASARPLVAELMERGGDVESLVRERGLEAVSDTGLLESAADAAIEAHAEVAEQVRAGEDKGLNFLMGQVMKRTQGKADPKAVREILTRKLRG